MVDFFHAHPSDDEPSIQAETDRYIVWPGQALGYKLGEMQILRLRAKAEKVLGAWFDLRAFRDVVWTKTDCAYRINFEKLIAKSTIGFVVIFLYFYLKRAFVFNSF